MSRTWTAGGWWYECWMPSGEYKIGRAASRGAARRAARQLRQAGLRARYIGKLRHRP